MAKTITTDRGCATAKAGPDGTRADHTIGGSPGLKLRVTADGRKSWSLLYRRASDGKRCRVGLGEYPAMGLADAKTEAGRLRNVVRLGEDPAGQRTGAKKDLTFAGLAEQWIERHAKVKKRSWPEDQRMLDHDILPRMGVMRAKSVAKADVVRVVDTVADRGSGYMANRVLVLVRTIYNWGARRGLVEINPAALLDKPIDEEARTRKLSRPEIKKFWLDIDGAPATEAIRLLLRLSLLLGQRINELAAARKSEFDLSAARWTIPGRRAMPGKRQETGTKNKLDHVLPLGPKAVELLERVLVLSKGSEWLFPSPRGRGDVPVGKSAVSRAWGRSRDELGLADVHAHDLRRSFATIAGWSGYTDFEIGLCLGHITSRAPVTGIVYNQADYIPEKTRVIRDVEERLLAIVEDREPEIVESRLRA